MLREASPSSRRKARIFALKALYETDVADHSLEASLKWLRGEESISEEASTFALKLTQGVRQHRKELDLLIAKLAPAWPVQHLSVIDRNILRMALFEIFHSKDTPHKAAINEAVELAKTFGSESSPRFVNGVLGSVMDSLQETPEPSNNPSQAGR